MSDFYSPPPTGRENAPPTTGRQNTPAQVPRRPLPEGWSEHKSRSHPDRVFYWNCRTNVTVWNLEDLFPTGQGPVLSSHAITGPGLSSHAFTGPELSSHALTGPGLSSHALTGPGLSSHALIGPRLKSHAAPAGAPTQTSEVATPRSATLQQERSVMSQQESSDSSSVSNVGLSEIDFAIQQSRKKNMQLDELKRKKILEMEEQRKKSHNTSRRSEDSNRSSESESSSAPSQKENIRKDLNNSRVAKMSNKDLLDNKNTSANDRLLNNRVKTSKTETGKKTSKDQLKERKDEPGNKIKAKSNIICGIVMDDRYCEQSPVSTDFKIPKRGKDKVGENFQRKAECASKNFERLEKAKTVGCENNNKFLEAIESVKANDRRVLKRKNAEHTFVSPKKSKKDDDLLSPKKSKKDEGGLVSPRKSKKDEGNLDLSNSEDSFAPDEATDDEEKDDVSWKRTKKKRSKQSKTSHHKTSPETSNQKYRNSSRSNKNGEYPVKNRDDSRNGEHPRRNRDDNRNRDQSRRNLEDSRDRVDPRRNRHISSNGDRDEHPRRNRDDSSFSESSRSQKLPLLPRANSPEPPENSLFSCDIIPKLPKPRDNVHKFRDNSTISTVRDQKVPSWPSSSNTRVPSIFDDLPLTSSSLLSSPSHPSSSVHSSSKLDDEDDYKMDEDEIAPPILTSGLRSSSEVEIAAAPKLMSGLRSSHVEIVEYTDPYDALDYSEDGAEFSGAEDSFNTSKVASEAGSINWSQDSDAWCPDEEEVDRPLDTSFVKEVEEEEAMDWEEGPSVTDAVDEANIARRILEEIGRPEAESDYSSNSEVSSKTGDNSALMVVVDTCVLMSSLAIVEDIRDNFSVKGKKPLLMIPWTVIRELDAIKDRKDASNKADASARRAIKWIQAALRAKHPQMRGQTIKAENKAEEKFKAECGDDRILQYCMVLEEEKTGGSKVLLLTNDRNLENKAWIHGIAAADHETVKNQLNVVGNAEGQVEKKVSQDEVGVVGKIVDFVQDIQYKLFEAVFVREMVEAFGENMWKNVVKVKPKEAQPFWELADLFKLFSLHQYAVFSQAYPKQFQLVLEELSSFGKKKNADLKLHDTLDFVSKFQKFVDLVEARGKNHEEVKLTKEKLSEMQKEVKQMLVRGVSKDEGHGNDEHLENGKVEENGPVTQLFTAVWTRIEDTCSRLCDLFAIENELNKIEGRIFSLTEAEEVSRLKEGGVPYTFDVFGQVTKVGENLFNLLTTIKGGGEVNNDQPSLVTLLDQLNEILRVLGEQSVDIPKANTRQLLNFLSSKSNAGLLDQGLEYLVVLRDLLFKCCQKIESQR